VEQLRFRIEDQQLMNGTVIAFDPETGKGLIRGSDGARYGFTIEEWLDRGRKPAIGHIVDFDIADGDARQIAVLQSPVQAGPAGEVLSEAGSNGSMLGIISIGLGVLALLPAFGIIAAIIGAVVGFFGRRQAKAANNSTAKLLSVIGLCLCLVILAGQVIIAMFWTSLLFGTQSGSMF
jgi:cold shock CspA family protein